ncbi:hypothetical protein HGRIS_011896 [Hohenbuehelia grisea]|uniref:UBC core domain-containing protein n=1 Tax=Hohenbuehelia grisea TaxID=104357 RepID=A0ABR3JYP8_9AGAR
MPPAPANPMSLKRIHREVSDLQKEDLGPITLAPTDSLYVWKGSLPGPEGSPYEGGVFNVEVQLAPDYPFSAPRFVFTTKIYHMNISDRGSICIDILKHNWSPALSLFKVMLSLSSLLTDPNPHDPLVPSIAVQYMRDRRIHDQTARQWTELYAQSKGKGAAAIASSSATPTPPPAPPMPGTSTSTTRSRARRRAGPPIASSASHPSSSTAASHPTRAGAWTAPPTSDNEVILIDDDEDDSAPSTAAPKRSAKRRRVSPAASAGAAEDDEVVFVEDDGEGARSGPPARKRPRGSGRGGAARAGTSGPVVQGDVIVIDD